MVKHRNERFGERNVPVWNSRKSHAEFRNFMRVCTIPIFFTIISSGVGAGPVGTAMARQQFSRLHSNDIIYCFKNNEAYCLNTIALPIINYFLRH